MSKISEQLSQLRQSDVAPVETPASTPKPAEVYDGGAQEARSELYEVRRRLHARLAAELGNVLYKKDLEPERLSRMVREHVLALLRSEPTPMSAAERKSLLED